MQILEPGEYNGLIQSGFKQDGAFVSVSSYQQGEFNDAWHYHVNAHISFVLKGGRSEQKKDRYECLPGKTTFYMPGEAHRMIRMQDSTHINLELERSFLQKYDINEQDLERIFKKTPNAVFLMLAIYKELATADQYSEASISMLLVNFLHQAERWRFDDKIPAWINTVRAYLHENWAEKICLTELSEVVGIHPVSISHYFPRYFSTTLGCYMRKLKTEQALARLNEPNVSLTSVAYECGFFDQSHFIRIFKEHTGFLPSQYLKLLE